MNLSLASTMPDRTNNTPPAVVWMCFVLAFVMVVLAGNANADDIDIFGAAYGGGATPNVIIIVDNNTSNNAAYRTTCPFTAQGLDNKKLVDMVECAIYSALDTMKSNDSLKG